MPNPLIYETDNVVGVPPTHTVLGWGCVVMVGVGVIVTAAVAVVTEQPALAWLITA